MTFKPGDQIKVTLSGPPFKGFLLEARNAEDLSGPPVGSFTLIDSQVSQLLTCEDTQFNTSDCGNKKFCIRSPENCDPEKELACVFLSFTRDDQSVMVEMSGPSKGYLSFALSHDQWMGDDDAYVCIREDQTVRIQPAHLVGRSHPVMDPRDPLEDTAWRLMDGVMQCSFRRNATLPGVKNRFDLNASYYIFLADGAADDGALMFVAWMTTVSIGVLIARFFKPVWSKALFGNAAWFQVHRMLMLTTSALTFIAFPLPFIYRRGWNWKTYAMIGFVAWHVGAEIVLEIHAYRLSRKGNLLQKPRDVEALLYKLLEYS
ncbi:hypothetical protein CB1_001428098 [Camelus ferus]|nr:hypothetical protein CB1_001428098 [Camelus ferus]